AQTPQRPARADRDEVLSREEGRWRLLQLEELDHRRLGTFGPAHVEAHQAVVDVEVSGDDLFGVTPMPVGGRGDRVHVAEVADPPMAVRGEVSDPAPNSLSVVGQNSVGVEERRGTVHEYDRRPN